jgi:methylthioribulose-1-phosphate dehydratase
MPADAAFQAASRTLAEIGGRFYGRGWVMGTSGNFSAVVSRDPLRLAMTPSAVHKGHVRPEAMLLIDRRGKPSATTPGRPSAETRLHLELVNHRGAGAVLHTHSVWSTMLSDRHAGSGALEIEGYEMLKGLDGIQTHEHRERIPIIENDQDMPRLARVVRAVLKREPVAHAFLLRRHGLYTWGRTLADAERHVEILEFLFETVGRTLNHGAGANSR